MWVPACGRHLYFTGTVFLVLSRPILRFNSFLSLHVSPGLPSLLSTGRSSMHPKVAYLLPPLSLRLPIYAGPPSPSLDPG